MLFRSGGIRTPFIAHWPAGISARGALRSQPGHVVDLMATFAAVSGSTYPAERNGIRVKPTAGVNLAPAFAGQPLARTAPLCFENDGSRALREGDWKLVSVAGDAWELYDLATDPTEMRDLAASQPQRVNAMAARWLEWAKQANVDLAVNPFARPSAPKAR